jgi:5'-methylthioadenosine phosphorylase
MANKANVANKGDAGIGVIGGSGFYSFLDDVT